MCISAIVRTQTKYYNPIMTGNHYAYADAKMEEQEVLHTDAHVFFNHISVHNEPNVTAVIMDQLSPKSGLKKWGKKGRGSFHSYINQLHMRGAFTPLHREELTEVHSNTLLESHIFLKEKIDQTLNGRTVAGDNKQRDFISK